MADIALRIDVKMLVQRARRDTGRFVAARLQADERLLAQLLEFAGGEARLAQHVGDELQRLRQVFPRRLEMRDAARDLELVEGVGQLHAVVFRRAAHQHGGCQARQRPLAKQILLVADVLAQVDGDRLAAVLFR